MIRYFCFYPKSGWPNPRPKLHDHKDNIPAQCYLDMSSAGTGRCWVFRADYTEGDLSLSLYYNGQWIQAGAPPTLQDAVSGFKSFISHLQGSDK